MLSRIRLRYYTDDEIRTLGVVGITQSSSYDRGIPKAGGINDPKMGLFDHTVRCPTCYKSNCDQHYGYINLEKPVYRLGTINIVLMILRSVCRECAKPKFSINRDDNIYINETIQSKNYKEKLRFISDLCRTKLKCNFCGAPQPVYTKKNRTFIEAVYKSKDINTDFCRNRGPDYISYLSKKFMPDDAASILFGLDKFTIHFLGIDRPNSLMCTVQIVPPPIIRPSNFAGETKVRSENDLTSALQDVVRTNLELRENKDPDKVNDIYDKLQIMISGITNHAIKRTAATQGILPMITATSKRKIIDIKTRFKGKTGRVRGNLSGKRVDQSGRTVISGDSSSDVDQLGVPNAIMNKLTFPECVTDINASYLRRCIIIGAYENGGALAVKAPNHTNDNVIWLPILDNEARIELSSQIRPGWIVERHLIDGDWVLFNRQPSLWKASIMAFRCYRVTGLTVRLPLPVTRAFNADFDGDEMNIHALQGYEAIAEAKELMRVDKQIITPQSGTVIIGLVQDSLVGAYRLSRDDCFLDRDEFMEILSSVHYTVPGKGGHSSDYSDPDNFSSGFHHVPWPAIFTKTVQLWTGKQLASVLIPNTVSFKNGNLLVRNGQILEGRLSKAQLGASNTGFIQYIWRLYGSGGALKFISDAQRLFVRFLSYDGPSQSILDCLMGSENNTIDILKKHLGRSDNVLQLNLPDGVKEAKNNSILQETLRFVGASVLSTVRENSGLSDCVNSGSKGNVMNIAQIRGCVGQQNIYGKRIPLRETRLGLRTLIYYAPNDLRAETRGFVSNSYMSGLTPAEFFEHQMAGREGIVATAVNTSETGYNQRRMIKGQESQCIAYDGTVRVSESMIIQQFYGGDDLDGSKIERIHFNDLNIKTSYPIVQKALSLLLKYSAYNANMFKDTKLIFPCGVNVKHVLLHCGRLKCSEHPEENINTLSKVLLGLHARHHCAPKAVFNVSVACAIIQVTNWINEGYYFGQDEIQLLKKSYASSLVNAGEGVGSLGASSIGEPSMQKTLNTFHYTGIADKNVTITGLPRFKQLINGSDTYDSANMTAELKTFGDQNSTKINTVMLHNVLKNICIGQKTKTMSIFETYGTARGPFFAKFGGESQSECFTLLLEFDWNLMFRESVDLDSIVKSLRQTLSFDGIVISKPVWDNASLTIIMAPWISSIHANSISEALREHHQIRGLDYVQKAIIFQEKKYDNLCREHSSHVIETYGSNVLHLASCASINPQTIRTTNVTEISKILGITTGIAVLQTELHKVLSFDGSYIDTRHSWLLADTMGRSGYLSAMNRHHMPELGSSLLQEASFERSLDVFEEGAVYGRADKLTGATERIIVGQPVNIGTGIVHVVLTNETKTTPQILVAPLSISANGPIESTVTAPIIKPLKQKESYFDVSAFALKISDMEKICPNSFFEKCATSFRSIAATKRIVPYLKFTSHMTESAFKSKLAMCWDAQWNFTENLNLCTEVYWPYKNAFGVTYIKGYSRDLIESYEIEYFAKDNFGRVNCEITSLTKLNPSDIPFGVSATRVIIKQITSFSKGPFKISFSREWTGVNNTDAEDKLLKIKGDPCCTLEMINPDSILKNRSTDAQLANALLHRLAQ